MCVQEFNAADLHPEGISIVRTRAMELPELITLLPKRFLARFALEPLTLVCVTLFAFLSPRTVKKMDPGRNAAQEIFSPRAGTGGLGTRVQNVHERNTEAVTNVPQ